MKVRVFAGRLQRDDATMNATCEKNSVQNSCKIFKALIG